ncbi:MAG: hypothetical protein CL927_16180 [Deltaproteobacteria bacterium]|nr:hypothetical protein [Deltaproteobacteria bacterium]HCH66768.1 hypothetical protein [Deltaproteobacteria bacterium]
MRHNGSGVAKTSMVVLIGLLAGGCEGQKFAYDGETLWERFPLDGDRLWEYVNEDSSVEFSMAVEKTIEGLTDGKTIATLTYTAIDSEGGQTLLHEIDWSSDADDGIEIWRWTDFTADAAGTTTEYSPPVLVAARQMNSGDTITTATSAGTFTTQYLGLQDCPNNWSNDTWECARLTLSSDVGGEPFTGEYWIAMSYGVSWMAPTEVGGKWVLSNAVFDGNGGE